MTQRIAFFLFVLVAASVACKKVDTALAAQLQGYVNTFTEATADLQKAKMEIGEIEGLISQVSTAMPKDTTALHALKERLQMISNRVTVRSVEYADILKKCQEMASDYGNGKRTTEQVTREISLFGDRLNGAPDFTKGVAQDLSDIKRRLQHPSI